MYLLFPSEVPDDCAKFLVTPHHVRAQFTVGYRDGDKATVVVVAVGFGKTVFHSPTGSAEGAKKPLKLCELYVAYLSAP